MSEQQINDGGPAYPTLDNTEHWRHLGLSIRDYFAAAALQGMLADPTILKTAKADGYVMVDSAYQLSDAMLERRKR